MGDPPWLAEVITSGDRARAGRRAGGAPASRPASRPGRPGPARPRRRAPRPGGVPARSARPASSAPRRPRRRCSAICAAAARSATMTANGLAGRVLRRRSSATTAASSARQARWKPPMPLTATMRPATRAATAAPIGSPSRDCPAVPPCQPGSAVGAGDGLRVVAAVEWVVVLRGARRAHREAGHGGHRPVVGQVGDDGVARPAVGARDERMPVSAVGRVAHLAQAVLADRDVGRDERARVVAALAADDLKSLVALGLE